MRKLLLSIMLLFSSIAWCNQRYQGVCAQSGKVITSGLSSSSTGLLTYPGATVTVNVVGGGLATIFSDNLGTPLANPFTASGTDASFSFYAANSSVNRYSVTCSGTGIPTISINPDALLFDPAVATFGTGAFSGNVTVGGTLGVTGASTLASLTVTGASSLASVNSEFVVGTAAYPTIQSAITAAGTTGSVLIPASYTGADSYSNTNGVPVTDLRINNNAVGIWSVLQASFPTSSFALGNDLALHAAGPADVRLRIRDLQVTSSTSTVAATPVTVTVASPTLYGVAQTGNATALFSTNAGIILEPGTANEETVAVFTIAGASTLSFTPAANHTQPFKIRQQGVIFLDSPRGMQPTSDPTGQYNFFTIFDGNGNAIWKLPIQNGAFPLNAPQQSAIITGGNGANSDLAWRNNKAASVFKLLNSGNTAAILQIDDSANWRGASTVGLNGATSGIIILQATAIAGGNFITFPAVTDTVAVLGTFAAPPCIGCTTPAAGHFTTISATGQVTSTLATGTAPLVIASTTPVTNLTVQNCGATCAITQPTISTGVSQGSGLKHQRFGISCATGAAVGAVCNTTYTWTSAFADANYTVTCTIDNVTSGVPTVNNINTKGGATFNVSIAALTAAAAQATNVDCIAIHD